MAENENQSGASETAVQEPPYSIRIEDAGPATKKVWIEIPKEEVAKKIAEQFKELRQEAAIPGFRKGHAPQKLLEKKFSADIRDQVRRTLISESYEMAVAKNSLQVIGEPEFDNPEQIQLKDDQPLNYCFSIEVQPEIKLPELKGIKVKKPKIQVTEEHIDQAMKNLREQQGTLILVEDRGVQDNDYIIAEVHAMVDNNVVHHSPEAQIVVRPGRLAGIQVEDLPKQLEGMKPTDMRTVKLMVPADYPTESLRGKELQIDITVKDIKRLEAAEINKQFLDDLGFTDEKELRDALREQMEERIQTDIQQAMRNQVIVHLLTNVTVDLPTRLSIRQADRVVSRRAVSLMMRGVPREQIEANVSRLKMGAEEEAVKELKTFFILQQVAKDQDVDVSEAELNGRISMIALQQGKRPEKVKQEMAKDGTTLMNLYVQIREEKAIDNILKTAEVEEVEPTAEQQKATEPGSESSAT
ncbi:MAG: trigger factor [Planctomycetota bacterium]|nr:trigger factor [Planctomycetota bacterium]